MRVPNHRQRPETASPQFINDRIDTERGNKSQHAFAFLRPDFPRGDRHLPVRLPTLTKSSASILRSCNCSR